jgi:hypothetical protein
MISFHYLIVEIMVSVILVFPIDEYVLVIFQYAFLTVLHVECEEHAYDYYYYRLLVYIPLNII